LTTSRAFKKKWLKFFYLEDKVNPIQILTISSSNYSYFYGVLYGLLDKLSIKQTKINRKLEIVRRF
jgi:hypothetical protein